MAFAIEETIENDIVPASSRFGFRNEPLALDLHWNSCIRDRLA